MLDTVDALILDLLEWLGNGDRSYAEVMDAWRTSCPRLPVWEDANDRGLLATKHSDGRLIVAITPAGRAFLEQNRRERSRQLSPNTSAISS
jgi:D-3-phosphoglycerate dehydrogenase / 2-oxoglutarate reductase